MINPKLLALLLLTGLTGCSQSKFEQLDQLLKKTFRSHEPGAAVGIVKGGNLVFEKYYGLARLEDSTPVSPATNFNIGSVTKQFTAAAVLQLVERNEISLTDTLNKFFPELHPAIGKTVTIYHLLTHTSGIKEHYPYVDTKPGQHVFDLEVLDAVRKMDSLYFPPGTRYRYSNTAYCLLALIVEQVSSHKFRQYIKRNIFSPLDMTHSDVVNMEEHINNRAFGYAYDSTKRQFMPSDAKENAFFTTEGDGGIYTSLRDYVKWVNGLYNEKILQKSSVAEATQIQYLIDSIKQLGYGFGWFVENINGKRVVRHEGEWQGFTSFITRHAGSRF